MFFDVVILRVTIRYDTIASLDITSHGVCIWTKETKGKRSESHVSRLFQVASRHRREEEISPGKRQEEKASLGKKRL